MTQSIKRHFRVRSGVRYSIEDGPSRMGLGYSLLDGARVGLVLGHEGSNETFDVVIDLVAPESGRSAFIIRGRFLQLDATLPSGDLAEQEFTGWINYERAPGRARARQGFLNLGRRPIE